MMIYQCTRARLALGAVVLAALVAAADTPALLPRAHADGLVPASVAGDETNGHVLVTMAGRLSVLDGASGRLLRTAPVPLTPFTPVVDERMGRAFLATPTTNSVSVLDAGSGRTLRVVPVGRRPGAVAVD